MILDFKDAPLLLQTSTNVVSHVEESNHAVEVMGQGMGQGSDIFTLAQMIQPDDIFEVCESFVVASSHIVIEEEVELVASANAHKG